MQLDVKLDKLMDPKYQLRSVRHPSFEYLQLRTSIEAVGILQPILVRPISGGWEIVDGTWRVDIARYFRMETIPALVKTLTDEEVLVIQIQTNANRPITERIDFAHHLEKIVKNEPGMTIGKLSAKINMSFGWIKNTLRLIYLNANVAAAVKGGDVSLEAAYVLARLPSKIQDTYLADAIRLPAKDFVPIISSFGKDYKEYRRCLLEAEAYERRKALKPYYRPIKEAVEALDNKGLLIAILSANNCHNKMSALCAGIKWTLKICEIGKSELYNQEATEEREIHNNQELRKFLRNQIKGVDIEESID